MAKKGGGEVAVRRSTVPADWQEQMKKDAEKGREREAAVAVGQFVSIRGGVLSFQGAPVPGNKLHCVILVAILENSLYAGEYDQNNPQPPVCYAFGENEDDMAPHEKASDPQHEKCAACPENKWGSAKQGRGKACKNSRRMAIMHADSLGGDLDTAAVAYLKIPPTSLAGWAQYVKNLERLTGKPVYAVVTEIGVVPDPNTQFKVTFTLVKEIDKKQMPAVFARAKQAEGEVAFPYQAIDASAIQKGARKPGKQGQQRQQPQARAQQRAATPPPPQQRGGGFGARQQANDKLGGGRARNR